MPYKDKETAKEASKLRMQRMRQGVTKDGSVTPKYVTPQDRIAFIQQELKDPFLIEGIEQAANIFQDRDVRYERAYRYKLWRDEHPHGYQRETSITFKPLSELLEATK